MGWAIPRSRPAKRNDASPRVKRGEGRERGIQTLMKDIFLLDMDDTLLDFPKAERAALFKTLASFGIAQDETLLARYHEINDTLWKALERGEIGREELKVRRFARLFAEFALPADPAAVSAAYFSEMEECCFPFEGVHSFLETLKTAGRVYICTNGGKKIQRRHIELAGFAPYFDGVFISEEIGADKPSAAFAGYVTAHIEGYAPARAVYLGDSLTSDKKCAEVMGADFVLFAPRGIPAEYQGAAATSFGEALPLMLSRT